MGTLVFLLLVLCAVCYTLGSDNYVVMMDDSREKKQLLSDTPESKINPNRYKPTWESLDSRPLPTWYDEEKFGILIHWGVFSVPSFGSEWFWDFWKREKHGDYHRFMEARYPPNFTYQDFARDFTAEFFDPVQWSRIFKASGARYVVITSKHHEGYTMWPSRYSFGWNSADVGPQKDLVGELARALRNTTDLKFGIYHSLYEWYNPMYLFDKKNNFTTDNFVTQKTIPELHELVEAYRPEVIWSDGDWDAPDTYWKSREFLAWLYNDSPVRDTVLVNDRWGINIPCNHGDFYTCEDKYFPGKLQPHKWESCMAVDNVSWGFRRNAVLSEYLSLQELIKILVVTVSCGGNLLLNIGPTKDGIISPIFEERLRGMGAWLQVNGEAIYKSTPWTVQNDTLTGDVWYTQGRQKKVYATLLSWPKDNILRLRALKFSKNSQVFLLGYNKELKWQQGSDNLQVNLPVEAHQGKPAWVIRYQPQA